jgi:hypothetical protein
MIVSFRVPVISRHSNLQPHPTAKHILDAFARLAAQEIEILRAGARRRNFSPLSGVRASYAPHMNVSALIMATHAPSNAASTATGYKMHRASLTEPAAETLHMLGASMFDVLR